MMTGLLEMRTRLRAQPLRALLVNASCATSRTRRRRGVCGYSEKQVEGQFEARETMTQDRVFDDMAREEFESNGGQRWGCVPLASEA